MTLVLSFVLNAAINFVLGLLVAYFLGPEEFGRYAIGAALMVLINAACLDWLKLAAARFYSEETRDHAPAVRATLDVLAAGISMALAALVLAAALAGVDFGLPIRLLAAAVVAGICAGLFEYHAAIARARFLDGVYARLILIKNLLSLVLMVGGAWLLHDAALVILGSCLSVAASLLTVRRALADAPLDFAAADRGLMAEFAHYALPLVGANVLYAAIPLINRSLLASAHGFAEAGYFALASDIGLKLFGAASSALELVLLQNLVRLNETQGRAAAERRMADNLIIVLMVLAPIAAGLWLALPAFEALLVPAGYRGHFAAYFTALIPAFISLGLFQAGFNPALLIEKKTRPATWIGALAVGVTLASLAVAGRGASPIVYAWAQSAGFLAALVATGLVAARMVAARPKGRDVALIAAGLLAMVAALTPWRGTLSPIMELALMGGIGALLYGATMLAGDVAGCRTALKAWRIEKAAQSG